MKSIQELIERHGGIAALKEKHISLENPPYMRLAVECLSDAGPHRHIISVTHWGEQNGAAMRDPDMTFFVIADPALKTWEFRPLTFRNDYAPDPATDGCVDREFAVIEDGIFQITNRSQYADAREFTLLWDKNIRD